MKILSGLLCALFLTACSTSTSLQRHFDNNYDLALKEINAGNYATAYRKLSSYFRYNDTVPGAAERKAKIKNLFDTHPEIRSAALNTFTKDSFQQTVSKFRGKKHVASSREMDRIDRHLMLLRLNMFEYLGTQQDGISFALIVRRIESMPDL